MLFKALVLICFLSNAVAFRPALSRASVKHAKFSMLSPMDMEPNSLQQIHSNIIDSSSQLLLAADEAVSVYSKVDKTGFIGFIATYVENAIDLGHNVLNSVGLSNNYGFSIIAFTIFIKFLTLPLVTKQLQSTTKMQQLQPFQQKIQQVYANDEQTKNQLMAQLFQTANVNPLAGCFPAIVQIPIFISLYRALQNLVAENKLDEPFLWIPDLEGPVYNNPPGTSMNWIKSAFSGNPDLGWHDTLCFLSLPLILYISQTLSQKLLQPKRDPNRKMSESEEISQGLINNLPFIVAFFSINVPAGLAIYWVANNILTTVVTLAVKSKFANDPVPIEVTRMMAAIEGGGGMAAMNGAGGLPRRGPSSANAELRGFGAADSSSGETGKPSGFGSKGSDFEAAATSTFAAAAAASAESTGTSSEASAVAPASVITSNDDSSSDSGSSKKKSKRSKSGKGKK